MKIFKVLCIFILFFSTVAISQTNPPSFLISGNNSHIFIRDYILNSSGEHIILANSDCDTIIINGKPELINKGLPSGPVNSSNRWPHQDDVLLAKYNKEGTLVYKKQAWCRGRIYDRINYYEAGKVLGFKMAEDHSGNLLVSGQFHYDTLHFGDFEIYRNDTTSPRSIFFVKLDKSGNILWHKVIKGGGNSTPGLVVDENDFITLAGIFWEEIIIDSFKFRNDRFSVHDEDIFIARFSPDGETMWAQCIGNEYFNGVSDLAYDGKGNYYITGSNYRGLLVIGKDTIKGSGSYLACFGKEGKYNWARRAPYSNWTNKMKIDSEGNLYMLGSYGQKIDFSGGIVFSTDSGENYFLIKFDAQGTPIWAKAAKESFSCRTLVIDKSNNIIIAGSFGSDTFQIGNYKLINKGESDLVLAAFNQDGNINSVVHYGGEVSDDPLIIQKDEVNNIIYLAGWFGKLQLLKRTV